MADINLPKAMIGKDDKETIQNLYDAYYKLRKELDFTLQNLDGSNIDKAFINSLEVGTDIKMGANARISWGQIVDPISMYTDEDALAAIQSTYIDANGVWTPNVYATNISTINGKITTAKIENLIVGSNVQMGANATISWGQVTSQPFIPQTASDVGALPVTTIIPPGYSDSQAVQAWVNSGYKTYITSEGVYTGNIVANQIYGGTISGVKINVTDDVYIGDKLIMGTSSTSQKGITWLGMASMNAINNAVLEIACSKEISFYTPTNIRFAANTLDFSNCTNTIGLTATAVFA